MTVTNPPPKSTPIWVVPLLSVVLPGLISVGVSWLTVQRTALDQEHQNFASEVRDMDGDFSPSDRSAIAFAGLSQLAGDEASSRALIMIGSSSKDPNVQGAFVAYLGSHPDAHKYLDKNWTATFTPSPKTAAIINAAQATPAPQGWVYVGETGTESSGGCDKVPVAVPQKGDSITFCGDHYIRANYSPDSQAVGVLKAGSVIVQDVNATKISESAQTVWVQISIPSSAGAAPAAPGG